MSATTTSPSPLPDSEREFAIAGTSWYLSTRAVIEYVFALTLLIFSSPLLLLAMALVKLTSRGPIFYCQTRVGRDGQPFTLIKLRSMRHDCEALTGACWSKPGDTRITFVGRWLRKTHIDELPQLFNVLRGEMSLIGPRPERPEFVPQLEQAIPHYRKRILVRPGVTGLAQVQLPPDTDFASVRLKLAYDLYYVQSQSPWLDLRICLATVWRMIGVPFRIIRSSFRFPRQEDIVQAYKSLPPVPHHKPVPRRRAIEDSDPLPVMS